MVALRWNRPAAARRLRWTPALAILAWAASASAVSPLEYPDNGGASFSRAGAWLATADAPLATHYNPAALATQSSAASIDLKLTYPKICLDRRQADGSPEQVAVGSGETRMNYQEVCNARQTFPISIPAIAVNWRASERLGVGFAITPPSAYGNAAGGWPEYEPAIDPNTGQERMASSPARMMVISNQSTILFPTASVGYELFDDFRVGVGFVAGIAVVNVAGGSQSKVNGNKPYDVTVEDSRTDTLIKDLFIPGAVLSIHWSPHKMVDVAAWGRWMDSIRATDGDLRVRTLMTDDSGGKTRPTCPPEVDCGGAVPNDYDDDEFVRFDFPFPPPEVRAGIRFHMPRSDAKPQTQFGNTVRDPLHDDVFDIELDGSYTWSGSSDEITIRFVQSDVEPGRKIKPTGFLPPIADRATGFKDSIGVRLGGQYNAIQDKLGLMAGVWYETEGQTPELLNVAPAGPARGGVAAGLVLRQNFIDFVFGYQYHWTATLDNGGNGALLGSTGSNAGVGGEYNINKEPRELPAVDRQQFRTWHDINGGSVSMSAHAFAIGSVLRF